MKNLYTKVPHWFFELAPKLKEAEFRVLTAIVRQTYGWNRKSDKISWTQLADMTGLSAQGISNGLAGLEKRGLIIRDSKTVVAQAITITPQNSEILATMGLYVVESETQRSRVEGLSVVESKTHEVESQSKPTKKRINETPPTEKLSVSQEESLAILVGGGLEKDISRQLIVKAWDNGRDSEYIKQVVGYVSSIQAKNPPGMIRTLIERNQGRIPASNGAGGTKASGQALDLSKYAHGGKDHKLADTTCTICHPDLLEEVPDAEN